jgi:group I intron endonuclease
MWRDVMICGIYLIKNIISGKEYVGSTRNLKRREYDHWRALKLRSHHNVYLQRSYAKYGRRSFVFVVVECCTPDLLIERENWWISILGTVSPGGYNLTSADRHEVSEETRAKLSAARKGKPGFFKGKSHSIETRSRLSAVGMGNQHGKEWQPTLEQRERMSAAKLANPTKISRAASEAAWKANSKTWEVISPIGDTVTICNLSKFCKEHNLHKGNMVQVSKGRLSHYRGWRVRQITDNQRA